MSLGTDRTTRSSKELHLEDHVSVHEFVLTHPDDEDAHAAAIAAAVLVHDEDPEAHPGLVGGGGDVTQEELDAVIESLAPLSDNVPLVAVGSGSAGADNAAARSTHVHPAQEFALEQPLVLEPGATNGSALVIKALAAQTGNLVEWRNSDESLIAAVGSGTVDVSDGVGFPQYTGFPRLRGFNYSTYGLLRCSGAFWVEKDFCLVGTQSIGNGQANYGNSSINLNDGNLTMTTFAPGGGSKWFFHEAALFPQLRLGGYAVDFTAVVNVSTLAAGFVGEIIQGSASQTADLSRWQDDSAVVGFAITAAALPKWAKAANVQTTVGSAGGASALPASPTKYLKVVGDDGVTYVVPAFAAS